MTTTNKVCPFLLLLMYICIICNHTAGRRLYAPVKHNHHAVVVTTLPIAKTGTYSYMAINVVTMNYTKEMSPLSVKPSISNQINEWIQMYSNST